MRKMKLSNDLVDAIKDCSCPVCRKKLDGRTELSVANSEPDATPAAGDVSVCLYCGARLMFYDDRGLKLRLMTPEEYQGLEQGVKDALNVDLSDLR